MDKVLLAIERDKIKQWLTTNDYKVNKVVVGEWTETEPKWLEFLEQRKIKVARLNEILELFKTSAFKKG
jgi:hypothetical protein